MCILFIYLFVLHLMWITTPSKTYSASYPRQRRVQGRERGGHGGPAPPIFRRYLFILNSSEELQTLLFQVELVINNALLTCVYSNTIKTCLTLNHLLFDRQLLYSSNTTSVGVRNIAILSSTAGK